MSLKELKTNTDQHFIDKKILLTDKERKKIKAVVAVIINNDLQILAFKRNYRHHFHKDDPQLIIRIEDNDFGLPGGYVDETDESLESAVLRELEEETGLRGNTVFPVFFRKGRKNGSSDCAAFVIEGVYGLLLPNSNLLGYDDKTGEPIYEGHAQWKNPNDLLNPSFTYYEYNKALLEYLGLV